MAITITQQPDINDLLSPYRPLEIKATSNDSNIKKMKCFIELDLLGTPDNASSPLILDPDIGTTNEFTFDISSYLGGVGTLTTTIQAENQTISILDATANSLKVVRVNLTEVVLNPSTGQLQNGTSSGNSNQFLIINGVWQHTEVTGSYAEFDDYKLSTVTTEGKFLTNYREARVIGTNDSEYISAVSVNNATNYLKVNVYTKRNRQGSVSSFFYPLSFGVDRFDIPVGSRNINDTNGGWTNSAGTPVSDPDIDSSVGSYTVQVVDSISPSAIKLSERLTYNLDHTICEDESTRIKFLNRLGAFEYFTFKGYRDRSTIVRNQYYNRALDASYSIHEGGDRVLASDVRTEFTVYSQAITEAQRIWLEEMLDGHECFVLEDGNYIPIKIRAGKTQIIQEASDLFTIKMTYQYANPIRRQHGGY